jgi:hypothetical protein
MHTLRELIVFLEDAYEPDELVLYTLFSKANLEKLAGESKRAEIWEDIIIHVNNDLGQLEEQINNAIAIYTEEWRLTNGK